MVPRALGSDAGGSARGAPSPSISRRASAFSATRAYEVRTHSSISRQLDASGRSSSVTLIHPDRPSDHHAFTPMYLNIGKARPSAGSCAQRGIDSAFRRPLV